MLLFANIIYVLVAIAMVALILMQRGAGAQAGSGFGGGASGTVFGSRGSSNFLSKATKWLAIAFFGISLFMAWNQTRQAREVAPAATDLGLMSQVPVAPAAGPAVPAAPASSTAPAASGTVPAAAPAPTDVPPAAPTQEPTQPASGG
ncbi:preprotein translocase subunit SecG [Cognatilysobacter tabacisoli]|uniref:preprotein translocase subunit SecG n=1 Tax=Cognatilysobacter tabacisoli TaxID=2315424 RepID=UPI000E6B488B|nr:preprotein translocase subunit SecG [Lysobacter tabacisoli]